MIVVVVVGVAVAVVRELRSLGALKEEVVVLCRSEVVVVVVSKEG